MARKKTGAVSGRFFAKKWTTTESVARGGSFFCILEGRERKFAEKGERENLQ